MRPADPLAAVTAILVSPQSAGNIGAAARAVKNMGLGGLRIIEPDDGAGIDDDDARRMAVHADDVLARITVHAQLEDATPPRTYLVATSARAGRGVRLGTPREAAARLVAIARDRPVAILFGREDHGLPNRLVERAHEGLTIPTAPAYASLNLAQAVLLVGYELRLAAEAAVTSPAQAQAPLEAPGPPAAFDAFAGELAAALTAIDFLKAHNRDRVLADLEALLTRARPDARELSMLRGICRQARWYRRQG